MSQNAFDKSTKISKKVAVHCVGRGATVWTVTYHRNWIHPKNDSGLVQSDGDMTGEIFLRHRVSLVWAPDVSDT